MRIALFVEDAGQLGFLRALVGRVLVDLDARAEIVERNSAGGSGATMSSLRNYLRDVGLQERFAEILVVAVDGNCHGWQSKRREIEGVAREAQYAGRCVCAVPDPHVEIWYLADGRAVAEIAEASSQAPLPAVKCERGLYKRLLREAFLGGGVDPPAGGAEYGEEIANRLDLERAERTQESLGAFLSDLRAAVREMTAAARG